jgi:hypothetical protein
MTYDTSRAFIKIEFGDVGRKQTDHQKGQNNLGQKAN